MAGLAFKRLETRVACFQSQTREYWPGVLFPIDSRNRECLLSFFNRDRRLGGEFYLPRSVCIPNDESRNEALYILSSVPASQFNNPLPPHLLLSIPRFFSSISPGNRFLSSGPPVHRNEWGQPSMNPRVSSEPTADR